jgi:two-component system uhpT operon response regulator UhpA
MQRNGHLAVVIGGFGPVINRGLVQILGDEHGVRIVADDLDRSGVETAVSDHAPHVAVLDEAHAVEPGILARLKAVQPGLGLVVLAYKPTRRYAMRLLSLGATSCLSKESAADDLLLAIRLAADGKHLLACASPRDGYANGHDERIPLTPREEQVAELLRLGRSNSEIALALAISAETVHTHAAHVYRKLGVNGRRELLEIELTE